MSKRKRTTVYLPDELHTRLKVYAVVHKQQMSMIVAEAVEQYLASKETKQIKEPVS